MERTNHSNHSVNVHAGSAVSSSFLPGVAATESNFASDRQTPDTRSYSSPSTISRDLLSEAELGLVWLRRRAELVRLEIQAIELDLALQHARLGETGSLLAWLRKNGTPWQEQLSVESQFVNQTSSSSALPIQRINVELPTNPQDSNEPSSFSDPIEQQPKQAHEPALPVPDTKPRSQKKPYTNVAPNGAAPSSLLEIPSLPTETLPSSSLKTRTQSAHPSPAQPSPAQPITTTTTPLQNNSPTKLTNPKPNLEHASQPVASAIVPVVPKATAKNTTAPAVKPRRDTRPIPAAQAKQTATNQPAAKTQHKANNKTKTSAQTPAPLKLAQVKQLPSWIVSSVVHAVLLLILLLFTIPLPKQKEKLGLSGTFEPNTNTSLQLENSATQPTDELQNHELSEAMSPSESLENVLQSSLPSASDIAANSLGSPDLAGTLSAPAAEGLGELKDVLSGKFVDNLSTTNSLASANFFGLEATGNIFCFVVDCSGSMRGDPFVATKQELLKTISQLKPNQRFSVFFFNQKVFPMSMEDQPPPTAVPATEDFRPEAVHATPENLMRLQRWMETVQIGSGGPPNQALKIAIKLEPDSIYLLTDGVTRSDVAGNLLKTNRQEDELDGPQIRCPIHTIGFYSTEGEALLQRIATENGGQYRYVPNPKPPKKSKKMEGGS